MSTFDEAYLKYRAYGWNGTLGQHAVQLAVGESGGLTLKARGV